MLAEFQKPECDALSLSVLVFLTSTDFQPIDSSVEVLPLCNDDTSNGWKCSCESPLVSISMDSAVSNQTMPLTTSAICKAISMIDKEDTERINAFTILGGIVDFDRISSGVYTSVILDNNLECVMDSFKNIPDWSTPSKYEEWKDLLQKKSGYFRRYRTSLNQVGGFSMSISERQLEAQWNDCPLDPIREIVFVKSSALSKLVAEAHQVSVVFQRPDAAFAQRNVATACFSTEAPAGVNFSDEFCLCVGDNEVDKPRHLYWKNRSNCRIMNCCNGSVSFDPSEVENSPSKKSPFKSTQKSALCQSRQEQLYNFYPTLKPADPCPGCQINPPSQSLSGHLFRILQVSTIDVRLLDGMNVMFLLF
eukprot:CAMPEP_0170071272 /NCGR_PEP_ID=MMETSP0019_2-20121128/9268_1 /TAXON_ID=98059 /ORGANISM="Dinobryon sp., Strain UTEXLB2267" /LENGTH=362 /DNA_ID=CAMNT_0010279793 /DNA_START=954 /DNA_END=2042 /DNA_ORIENTATION=-